MRLFRYRLRAALTRAEHEERICQMELARREAHLREARERVERLGGARTGLQRRLRWLQEGDVEVERVGGLGRELDRLGDLMAGARSLCGKLEEDVAAARGRLVEMARERRKLETHRDGLMARHRRAELSEEGKQLDDLAMTRFAAPGALNGRAP
jgi:flagellar export protein FliJ